MSETNDSAKDGKARAKADKAYAKASRPWFKKKRVWLLGIIVVAVIATNMGGGGSDSSSSNQSTETTSEVETPAIEVTAEQLITELESNALAAKNNWKDKKVVITGTLSNIDASGDYFSLKGNDDFSFINVQVYIDDSLIETVSAFEKGQKVTVTGEISDVGELLGYSVKAISIP